LLDIYATFSAELTELTNMAAETAGSATSSPAQASALRTDKAQALRVLPGLKVDRARMSAPWSQAEPVPSTDTAAIEVAVRTAGQPKPAH
jgi:hypothetical protein